MVGEQVDSHSTSDYERVAELHAGAAVFNTAELFQAKQVTFGLSLAVIGLIVFNLGLTYGLIKFLFFSSLLFLSSLLFSSALFGGCPVPG